jgi:hypothetical protein
MRQKIFSVSIKDCEVQTFRAGGPGGQNQNKRNTGVRIRHCPSGAVGESREHRTQLENKRGAFRRMAQDGRFISWVRAVSLGIPTLEEIERKVDEMMREENLKIEYL